MGSWVRTITSPFRKARTILNQQGGGGGNSGSITAGGSDEHRHHRPKKQRRHSSSLSSSGTPSATAAGSGDVEVVEVARSSQLYGDVMACAYEDVQVMWSMLDNKARLCTTAAAAAS
ncbi:uncharacterized protein LOC121054551 [Oryza brachyantha]|uniref:Uncharacterized protein n=1 Tax=Oryza brachyantha TaxID=4533 RepID=J3M3T0_ORYBR|nr:uncharacterized protein LOC121054551 [Oryza brachyantha]